MADEAVPRHGRVGPRYRSSNLHGFLKTFAGVAGNVLEWYDFAVFGFFSDVIGQVFFSKEQPEDLSIMESFAVFGGAFLMRPIGGLCIGYIGDVSGRKYALEISIFLMAGATTLMGCLPTYDQVGNVAILLLLIVRMLQGLSVGGQLMSSLVFTLEGHPQQRWGLVGSFVMACANIGTFLGGVVAYILRSALTEEQLINWGWRLPFLSGVCISLCGIYLKYFCKDDEICHGQHSPFPSDTNDDDTAGNDFNHNDTKNRRSTPVSKSTATPLNNNPLRIAFSSDNRRSLLASSMVPMLWSGGFYLSFVWMAIYMKDLIDPPVPLAFGVNSSSLLLLAIFFPFAGALSDSLGRRRIMTAGGILFGCVGPILIVVIEKFGSTNALIAFASQTFIGFSLSLWGAPMCAWLVETFDPEARLTSVSIGYNVAQAIGGGTSPFLATVLVEKLGPSASGILLVSLSVISMIGLWLVVPRSQGHVKLAQDHEEQLEEDVPTEAMISYGVEMREIS